MKVVSARDLQVGDVVSLHGENFTVKRATKNCRLLINRSGWRWLRDLDAKIEKVQEETCR